MTLTPLTVGFLFSSFLAMWLTGVLVGLAIGDLMQVRRERLNGAIQFMTLNNLFHQCGVFSLSLILFSCSLWIIGLDPVNEAYRERERVGMIVRIVVSCGVIADALRAFYSRGRMAVLVGEHMGRKGGRRKTDPPLNESLENDGGEGW